MHERRFFLLRAIAVGTLAGSLVVPGVAQAQQNYAMKISVPTIHDIPNEWISRFAAAIEKDSGGRIKTEIYPASQLGSIPRQIEGTQFGSIQCQLIPPEFMVGLDPRFQVMAAPGLVNSDKQGQGLAADPSVRKLMLGLGADKGLHGIGLFFAESSELISRKPLRTLADFQGQKIRIFASPFQTVAFERLGMAPVAMSLGDVVPALQQGTIDGAITGIGPVVNFHMIDAAKYVTTVHQPAIFIIAELNRKWFEALPADLQQVIEKDAVQADAAINPVAVKMVDDATEEWKSKGGSLIALSAEDSAKMMKTLASVGADVAKQNPQIADAYKIVTDAAKPLSEAAK